MTSSNITRLNPGKRNLHWCTFGEAVSHQLITTRVCTNLSNKCSLQICVLFRVQQDTTICTFLTGCDDSTLHLVVGLRRRLVSSPTSHSSQRRFTENKNAENENADWKDRLEDGNFYRIDQFTLESLRGKPSGAQNRQWQANSAISHQSFGKFLKVFCSIDFMCSY